MTSALRDCDSTATKRREGGRLRAIGAGLLLAAALLPAAGAGAQPTVATTSGIFTGMPSPSAAGVDVFFGIRYAASPAGAARWTPPQPPTSLPRTTLADVPGPACPQPGSTAPQSEDCLFLNIYVPASANEHSRLPVFFWIHGGALVTGTGVIYDPSVMVAENNIVVVTINYRLGALGWLVEPALTANMPSFFQNVGDAGNYGLMDQQFAMQWVRENIAGFGGDPHRVTIGGESAGGLSVSSNLASTTTARSSSAARSSRAAPICCTTSRRKQPMASSSVRRLPRPSIACPTTRRACARSPSRTSSRPNRRCSAPSASRPTSARGCCRRDCSKHSRRVSSCTSRCYQQEINLFLAELGVSSTVNTATFDNTLAREYPLADFPDPFLPNNAPSADEALSQIFTDLVFACNGSDSNIDLSRFVPVFAYEFNDPEAPPVGNNPVIPPNDVFGFPTASEHASELQFLFSFTPLDDSEQELADQMKTYWANFVKTGDPNIGREVNPWFPFQVFGAVQDLVTDPASPHPFFDFRNEHFCATWQPVLAGEQQR